MNEAILAGTIVSEIKFSHKTLGENFYFITVESLRTSGTSDYIKVLVSDRLMDLSQSLIGTRITFFGDMRSHYKTDNSNKKLDVYMFAKDVTFLDDTQSDYADNEVTLIGYICKKPTYRKSPNNREISDLFIAVNRPYGKSDYIPCIAWGRNARYASTLEIGTEVRIIGRMQSREYIKDNISRTVYEISVSSIDVAESEENSSERKN